MAHLLCILYLCRNICWTYRIIPSQKLQGTKIPQICKYNSQLFIIQSSKKYLSWNPMISRFKILYELVLLLKQTFLCSLLKIYKILQNCKIFQHDFYRFSILKWIWQKNLGLAFETDNFWSNIVFFSPFFLFFFFFFS